MLTRSSSFTFRPSYYDNLIRISLISRWQDSSDFSILPVSYRMELANSPSPSAVVCSSDNIQAVSACLTLSAVRASILNFHSSSITFPFSFRASCRSTYFSHSSHSFCCLACSALSSAIRRCNSSFSRLHSSAWARWVYHLRARSASAVRTSVWMSFCLAISRAMVSYYLSRSSMFSSYLVLTSPSC